MDTSIHSFLIKQDPENLRSLVYLYKLWEMIKCINLSPLCTFLSTKPTKLVTIYHVPHPSTNHHVHPGSLSLPSSSIVQKCTHLNRIYTFKNSQIFFCLLCNYETVTAATQKFCTRMYFFDYCVVVNLLRCPSFSKGSKSVTKRNKE